MAWDDVNPPVRRVAGTGAAGAEILQNAGYDIGWFNRLRLGLAKAFGQLEPLDKALPSEIAGVPVAGRQRMGELVELLRPFVSRPNFGKNPNDANDLLDAFGQRVLGLGGIQGEQASKLLQVYRRALAKEKLGEELPNLFEPEEPDDKGLVRFMRSQR